MDDHLKKKKRKQSRVHLTKKDVPLLFERHGSESVAELAKRTGLPYLLIYNVVHCRTASVNSRQYEILFGRPAPLQASLKIDGAAFRAMADLWLYLNEKLTKADLYRDLFRLKPGGKTDHRIFNGKIDTIDARLEHAMREKFLKAGVDRQLLDQWLDEFENIAHESMIPYARIRPLLKYLQHHLGVHPKMILNQSVVRYETGELGQVSRHVFETASALKQQTEIALQADEAKSIDEIRESVLGKKAGYTLFSDIEDELSFLSKHTGKSVKRYLGRSLWTYKKGKAKRISNARAKKILTDVDQIIQESPGLLLSDLPASRHQLFLRKVMNALSARIGQMLIKEEGVRFEKQVLNPVRPRDEYKKKAHGFTPLDMASGVLGMKRKAFDLMVAGNCEIFRTVVDYNNRWYLSDLYLKEISSKKEFRYISAKYERLAKRRYQTLNASACSF